MPNLNMADAEEPGGRPPVQPMMSVGSRGGGFRIVIILVVVLVLGGGGFYLYKSGKIPFLSPKEKVSPTEVVPPPDQTTTLPPTLPPETAPTTKPEPTKVEPKPMKPEPRAQTMGTGNYTVVIASFPSKQTADEEAAHWSSAGFQAIVSEKQMNGDTWYRVCIGRYETRQLATKAAKEMEHMFETGYWINKVQ